MRYFMLILIGVLDKLKTRKCLSWKRFRNRINSKTSTVICVKACKILVIDRLDLLEKNATENTNLSVKIQKTFELSTAPFIHKPLEEVSN